ncbi:DUF805 domain-containing protein [Maribacter algarum]|uniref:DUF805 domain-containing protein n=1 Tax=Maribacter algarum (ex Zhang et al. 2020) TaxID=2578118 RepID=A0A5S3PPF3_9FLAO|nr:DUF805 domain-containing protein [Maribacter algarum]TMM56251.1 DUF805 domain-containing protein [Maribacter algarum]
MNWYLKVLKQYADFSGRARRQEYWMYTLFNAIIVISLVFLSSMLGEAVGDSEGLIMIPMVLYILAVFIPTLAVVVRRLHDQDKSGWYILVRFIPIIGPIWLLVLLCTDGSPGPNQYGPDPKNLPSEINDIGVTEA